MQAIHRSGPLKQQNKSHKRGRHRSNRELQTANKGKVQDVKSLTKNRSDSLGRDARRNQIQQIRRNKRQEAFSNKRSIGSDTTPPILVMVYSKTGVAAIKPFFELIKSCMGDAVVTGDDSNTSFHLAIPKFKLRYHFFCVPETDLFSLMDGAKVSDILIIMHSIATDEDDLIKDAGLNAIYSHFLPTTVHVVHGMEDVPVKKRSDIKKNLQKVIEFKFPDEKLHVVDKSQDALQFLHLIGNCKRRRVTYKKYRPQILAEAIETQDVPHDSNFCKLIVTGYIRNQKLDVNSLIHIPGFGDFQMDLIEAADDPHPVNTKVRKVKGGMDVEESKIIQKADPMKQEPLESENPLDPMEGEQNFPTAEEIAAAAAEADEQKKQRKMKKVTKGTSEYQAAWILDEEDDDDNDGDDNNNPKDDESVDDEDSMADDDDLKPRDDDEELSSGEESTATFKTAGGDDDTVTVNEDDEQKYDEKMDEDEESATLKKIKQVRIQEMFPDEIDTPHDVPAKVRFARYRGLKSFSYSKWDSKENLPSDYSRIFQFQNFERTKRRVIKEIEKKNDEEKDGADAGSYVRIHIKNVPKTTVDHFKMNPGKPLLLTGLLKHEQKMSVLNFVIKKCSSYEDPIESKEQLIFHVGCRRFHCNPIFSGHTNGDKFKYEKFMRDDQAIVASVYAPITFPPASVVVFKELSNGQHKLAATGSLLSVNPDRMIIKRIVLSGHPFKINRRHAVIRYMFFNKDDILWFKPVELKTKYGRKGHIKEPLGTHGHMKCVFDRPLNSMDTVLMNLYKRIYPKWTYDPHVSDPEALADDDDDDEIMHDS